MSDGAVLEHHRAFLEPLAGTHLYGVRPDQRVPLQGEATLGRSRDNEVCTNDHDTARRHARVTQRGAQWHLEDLGTTNGTLINGRRVIRQVLAHGDLVVLGGTRLRFVQERAQTRICPELEEAIAESPEDDERWEVYADWLLERGEPLGLRLRGAGGPDDVSLLEGLHPLVADGGLELAWRHGFISRARLRRVSPGFTDPGDVLRRLLTSVVGRLVQALEVDVLSFTVAAAGLSAQLQQLLLHVAEVDQVLGSLRLPALRQLRVGPLWGDALPSWPTPPFAGLAVACPRLQTKVPERTWVCRRAWLELTGGSMELDAARPWAGHGLEVQLLGGVWRVGAVGGGQLKVNGLPRGMFGASLADGDELSAGGEVIGRFRAR